LQILEKLSYFTPENAISKSKNVIDIAVSFKEICLDVEFTVKEWNAVAFRSKLK